MKATGNAAPITIKSMISLYPNWQLFSQPFFALFLYPV